MHSSFLTVYALHKLPLMIFNTLHILYKGSKSDVSFFSTWELLAKWMKCQTNIKASQVITLACILGAMVDCLVTKSDMTPQLLLSTFELPDKKKMTQLGLFF